MTLRLSNFGIRGFVGESLTPRVVMDYTAAFATFLDGGRVLIGRDTRYSSSMLHASVTASLASAGCEILDAGVCPTPMIQFGVRQHGASGGISISGGHHPAGWNALTLIGADGSILEPAGGENVLDGFHAGIFRHAEWNGLGQVRNVEAGGDDYFAQLSSNLDVAAIRAARFVVLMDPVGGAGCPYLDAFAHRLGITLLPVNGQPTGYLARDPEPRPRNATHMASFIRFVAGDVGFVLSSDMGRLSVVTESGEPAGEEYTFALVADHVLSKRPGTVVTNGCTSRMIDDLAARHRCQIHKTPVGQAYVLSALADEQGVVGGEGSGGVALPAFQRAFDGFLTMGLILEAMATQKKKVSELIAELPRYQMVKRRVYCDSRQGYAALETLKKRGAPVGARVDLTDGLRYDWDDGWVHVRPSRTESLVRVLSEAATRAAAERRAEEMVRTLDEVI